MAAPTGLKSCAVSFAEMFTIVRIMCLLQDGLAERNDTTVATALLSQEPPAASVYGWLRP
jgi:hypothetical protein